MVSPPHKTLFMDTRYKLRKLKNGITVLLIDIPHSKIFRIEVAVNVGFIDEKNQNEFEHAHFWEHLQAAFPSSKYPGNTARNTIANLGVSTNASTSPDNTLFYVQGSSHDREKITDIVLQSLVDYKHDPNTFEQERRAVLNEISANEDSVWLPLMHVIHRLQYSGMPMEHNLAQNRIKNVSKTAIKELLQWKQMHYVPERMVVCVAGDLGKDPELFIQKHVEPIIGKKTSFAPKKYRIRDTVPPRSIAYKPHKINYVECPKATQTSTVCLVFPHPYSSFDNQSYILQAIAFVLTHGLDCRLYETLRTKHGLIYSVHADIEKDMIHRGLFMIETTVMKVQNVPTVVNLVLEELKYFCKHSIPELAKFHKTCDISEHMAALNRVPARFVSQYSAGPIWDLPVVTYKEMFNKRRTVVTESNVLKVANKLFRPKNTFIFYGHSTKYSN